MSRLRVTAALPFLAILALACQDPDVGQRCAITWGQDAALPAPTPSTVEGDFLETGNVGCDNLVCIVSPISSGKYSSCGGGDACGYCSKPCVSDDDCYKSETGLECRQMVLDPAFIAALSPEVREKYLADVSYSSYCAVPR